MKRIIIFYVVSHLCLVAQAQTRVIDMHIHSYSESDFETGEPAIDNYGVKGSTNAEVHRQQSFSSFEKFNIRKAMVSGNPESVEKWATMDKDQIIIRGILMYSPDDYGMDSVKFEQMIVDGEIKVFGEVAPYYHGTTLSDPIWQPYLRICEKYDVPVAVHTGGGAPGGTHSWSPKARLSLGDPYLIEDVLVKYPNLRVYLMHAGGEDWPEHTIRLMDYYRNLYVDLGVLLWINKNTQRYSETLLQNIKKAGFLNRVMFGTDQMVWPYSIEKSIKFLNSLDFLTEQDKEDIFYNNAVRFLKLKQ